MRPHAFKMVQVADTQGLSPPVALLLSPIHRALLDQRFERWVSLLDRTQSALQRAYHRRLRLKSL
jgi:hypothetical protein